MSARIPRWAKSQNGERYIQALGEDVSALGAPPFHPTLGRLLSATKQNEHGKPKLIGLYWTRGGADPSKRSWEPVEHAHDFSWANVKVENPEGAKV